MTVSEFRTVLGNIQQLCASAGAKCPFRNFLNRVNRLDSKEGDLIRGGVTDVDA